MPSDETRHPAELAAEIDRVRHAADGDLRSNYFFPALREAELPLWSSATSLIFLDRDHDFHRLYFLSRDLSDLTQLLADRRRAAVGGGLRHAADDHEPIDAALTAAGFTKMAVYLRMTNKDHPRRKAARRDRLCRAGRGRRVVRQPLPRFRHTAGSHPGPGSLPRTRRQQQAIVHRSHGEIDAYLIFQLQGRKAHPNYWYSRPDNHPAVALKVYDDFFADMAARGIRTSFLWVEARKTVEIGVYERFGYVRDGLVTHTYVNG